MAPSENPASAIVRLQYMIADPGTAMTSKDEEKLIEGFEYRTDEPMLDGPICRSVAIVDIDPETGVVIPGAVFEPPNKKRKQGRYRIKDKLDPSANDFRQVSVFSTVLRTMAMFEDKDVLGRRLRWAFDGEQLLVVPRAGRMQNAFYHRDSRSLQFFFFDADILGRQTTIYTCLSPDIISHEATHAILDGIAPDLYDSVSPQALALHEAIADLSAVIFSLRSPELALRQLKLAGGDLTRAIAFSRIAEQFGQAQSDGREAALRDLLDNASLTESWGKPVVRQEPHELSTVLSGALYQLLLAAHERAKIERVDVMDPPPADREAALFSASGFALYTSRQRLKRIVFRALDYLPPGEISFADFGRALIAADQASNPEPSWERDFITAEFVKRGIVQDAAELEPVASTLTIPDEYDLDQLVQSDWMAYRFAEALRDHLMIPKDTPFDVRPRLDVTKTTFRSGLGNGKARAVEFRECLFKVSWREAQPIERIRGFIEEVSVAYGTTLAIDWETRAVRALLTTSRSDPSQAHASAGQNARMRESYLKLCLEEGLVGLGDPHAIVSGGTLKLKGLARFLHMSGR